MLTSTTIILLSCSCWLLLSSTSAEQPVPPDTGAQAQCHGLCAACQSLRPARINQICSLGQLNGCSCPEHALNLTMAAAGIGEKATLPDARNCPATAAAAKVGFCPFGQRTDAAGCPMGVCLPAPGCQQQDSNQRPSSLRDCRAYCPAGYQTDAGGCPVCRCRCGDIGDAVDGAERLERRCAADCAAAGAAHEMRPAAAPEGCPLCLCRAPAVPIPAPAPAPAPALAAPCLLRCPNSCGPHGYADAESRDERGCVRDCSCRCPPAKQGCPAGDRCLRWEIDRFGCQLCSTCSGSSGSSVGAPPSAADATSGQFKSCITKATLDANPGAVFGSSSGSGSSSSLCPLGCQAFLFAADLDTGCLTCSCQQQQQVASSSPAKQPCPSLGSLDACLAGCPSGNVTVAKDANGCYACRCLQQPDQQQPAGSGSSRNCPTALSVLQRCGQKSSCGPYGFESDPVTGCQRSCRCNCPKRACGCFYGSRQDEFGCDTCECISAAEYLQFLPF